MPYRRRRVLAAARRCVRFASADVRLARVDLCNGCHALWLDANESVQLTPAATIALFRELSAAGAAARRALPAAMACPRCRRTLSPTQDLRHATRFTYWRCAQGHGRLTPFVQFLREKDFIRPLAPA